MADQDRYRDDRDDDRRFRGGESGGGDPYRGGEGPPGRGRVSPPGGGYGRQGGYDQGGREDAGRYASDYGREDRGGGQRGDPRGGRENQGGPRGAGGGGGHGRERSDYGPRVNEDIGQGAYGQGYVGNQGRGYGGGAERDTGRNAQAYDRDPEDRSWWERATDQVATWFGDEGAEQRRDADREADHRGRGPKGYKRSDERIREDVSDRLYDDAYVDASEIDVGVSGGEVTLSGTVDSRDARRRAEDVAERVSGVTYVQNNLRVDRPGSTSGPGSAAVGSGSGSPGVGGTTAGHGAPGGSSGASSDVTTPTGLGSGGASTGMGATGGSAVAASISDTGGSAAGMGANPGRIGTGMADTGNEGVGISTMTGTNRTSGS